MRYSFLSLLAFLFPSLCALGQNWRPFGPNNFYGYEYSDTGSSSGKSLILIRIESSIERAPGDSLWRFAAGWTPSTLCGVGGSWGGRMRSNSPFGNEVKHRGRDVIFYVWDEAGTRIDSVGVHAQTYPLTYLFGRYTVQGNGIGSTLLANGASDSVWTGTLNGQPIELSKNYGLLRMPAWARGLTMANAVQYAHNSDMRLRLSPSFTRYQAPTNEHIFNFSPGDTLGYHHVTRNWFPPSPIEYQSFERIVIRRRWTDTLRDELLYAVDRFFSNYGTSMSVPGTFASVRRDTLRYSRNLAIHTGVLYAGQGTEPILVLGKFPLVLSDGDTVPSLRSLSGYWNYDSLSQCVYPLQDSDGEEFYQPNRGLVSIKGYYRSAIQDCYSIRGRGIPCGRLITSTRGLLEGLARLSKNPVSNQIEILSPTPLNLTLQDLQGRTVAEGWDTRTLDVRMLPTGLYQLRAQDKQGRSQVLRVAKD